MYDLRSTCTWLTDPKYYTSESGLPQVQLVSLPCARTSGASTAYGSARLHVPSQALAAFRETLRFDPSNEEVAERIRGLEQKLASAAPKPSPAAAPAAPKPATNGTATRSHPSATTNRGFLSPLALPSHSSFHGRTCRPE